MIKNIYVRRLDDRSIVDTIPVTDPYPRKVEKIVMGMLINMNTEKYFVDFSECEGREDV